MKNNPSEFQQWSATFRRLVSRWQPRDIIILTIVLGAIWSGRLLESSAALMLRALPIK